jgi:hypothetical protein
MIIRSINGIVANWDDKAPLIALRYYRHSKPEFEAEYAVYWLPLGSGVLAS